MKTVTQFCKAGVALCAVAALTVSADQTQANQLANPGFEGPPIASGPAPFNGRWEPFSLDGVHDSGGDIAQTATPDPLSGTLHLELSIIGTPNSFAGVFQDLPSQIPGQTATFSGWSKELGPDTGGSEIRIEWRDSVNDVEITRTSNLVPVGLNPNTYTFWSLSDTVPAGADTARVVYAVQSFGAGPNQTLFVDDLSYVPEPASMALLGLGGLALMRRR